MSRKGSGKKKAKAPKKCEKEVYRVMKEAQWKDFDYQDDARNHLIECLKANAITFCSIKKVKVEGC